MKKIKKKKKKGFTLIELLAVIVILAIVALIISPVVSNLITSARKNANARTVEGHVRNVELAIIADAFATAAGDVTLYDLNEQPLEDLNRSLTMPTNDNVTCETYTISNAQVTAASKCADRNQKANWINTFKFTVGKGAEVDGELN